MTVQHTSPTYHYDVSVKFAESGTPIGPEPVAMLTGTLNVRTSRTITGVESGLCLDANGAGTATRTTIVLWSCNGQANQQWSRRS